MQSFRLVFNWQREPPSIFGKQQALASCAAGKKNQDKGPTRGVRSKHTFQSFLQIVPESNAEFEELALHHCIAGNPQFSRRKLSSGNCRKRISSANGKQNPRRVEVSCRKKQNELSAENRAGYTFRMARPFAALTRKNWLCNKASGTQNLCRS